MKPPERQPQGQSTMDLKTAVKTFKPVTGKVMRRLLQDNIITFPLDESDQRLLSSLSHIWRHDWYVAQMNKSFRPDKRAAMLAFPEFGKIERYILSTYLNLKPRMKVSVTEMADRIQEFFEVEYPLSKIKRVRQVAYNLRRRSREETCKRTMIQLALLEESKVKNSRKRLSFSPGKLSK